MYLLCSIYYNGVHYIGLVCWFSIFATQLCVLLAVTVVCPPPASQNNMCLCLKHGILHTWNTDPAYWLCALGVTIKYLKSQITGINKQHPPLSI